MSEFRFKIVISKSFIYLEFDNQGIWNFKDRFNVLKLLRY